MITLALKFPDASLATIALAEFASVAVVAEFATLPVVEIVASFESEIPPASSVFPTPNAAIENPAVLVAVPALTTILLPLRVNVSVPETVKGVPVLPATV